jgi:hypothetical protein
MVIVRQRRLAKEASKKQLCMRSAVTADCADIDVELARTVTKDSSRPTRVDSRPKHWETPKGQRIQGEASKAPIYRLLGKGQQPADQAPQPMPQAPPQAKPMATPQVPPPLPPPSGAPLPMPARPPTMPSKEQATLHQCPICGRMNKATDTTCPKCGGSL